MAKLNSCVSFPFMRFAAILGIAQCLSLTLVLAQTVDPDSSSGGNSSSESDSDSDSDSGPDKKPPVDTITKVPGTIADMACDTGRRNVVKVYKNGVLTNTERGDCV